jgi:putative ATPase
MLGAAEDVQQRGALPVPLHLRNAATPLMKKYGYGEGYRYAHDFPEEAAEQHNLPAELTARRYYFPADAGEEKRIQERLNERLRKRRGA